jgi:hypothetical protein
MIPILIAMAPGFPGLVMSIIALFKQYPQFTPEQISTAVAATMAQAGPEFESALAKMAAYEAAHPPA